MASKMAPTEYHSIVKIVRKAIVAIFINAIVADKKAPTTILITTKISRRTLMNRATVNTIRRAVISIGAIVEVLHIVHKVANTVEVAKIVAMPARHKVLATPKAVLIIAIELMAVVRKAVVINKRRAKGKETIGTPSAIMQTHANTKYNTGIAKENCRRY